MKTFIFGDVHLKVHAGSAVEVSEFAAFLRSIDPAEFPRVVMLGDLFDFWFEYRHVIFSGYFDVLRALADLRDAGAELHLVCGNHDFWAGRFLRDQLGVQVHPDRYTVTEGGLTVLFIHGDGVNPSDRAYRVYKRFARWPVVVRLFRMIHPDWAMALAQFVSSRSRAWKDGDFDNRPEIESVRENGRRIVQEGLADVVISGHTHSVDDASWEFAGGRKGRYLNTGDWMRERRYLVWDGAQFLPMQWNREAGANRNPPPMDVDRAG